MEAARVLNKAQIAVLDALAVLKTDAEVYALKNAIVEFFAKRADEEMERLVETGVVTQEKMDSWATAHFRTPYKYHERPR